MSQADNRTKMSTRHVHLSGSREPLQTSVPAESHASAPIAVADRKIHVEKNGGKSEVCMSIRRLRGEDPETFVFRKIRRVTGRVNYLSWQGGLLRIVYARGG